VILFGTFGTDELGEYASQVDIVARLQRLVNSGELVIIHKSIRHREHRGHRETISMLSMTSMARCVQSPAVSILPTAEVRQLAG